MHVAKGNYGYKELAKYFLGKEQLQTERLMLLQVFARYFENKSENFERILDKFLNEKIANMHFDDVEAALYSQSEKQKILSGGLSDYVMNELVYKFFQKIEDW